MISRVRALFRRNKLAADLEEELHYHLSRLEELKQAEGLSSEEAHLAARQRFGNVTQLKEKIWDIDLITPAETVLQDLRFAVRTLAKHPSFTLLALIALAVGIGVNTAVFTAYKAVLLQPLDAANADQLVNVYRTAPQNGYEATFSYPDYETYRDGNRVFSGLIATTGDELVFSGAEFIKPGSNLGGGVASAFGFRFPSIMSGGAEFINAMSVSENYFSVLGVNAVRGRVFLPQDVHDLELNPAVLISENYWQRRFGGDVSVLGKTVKLNGIPFTVIGITPHDFMGTAVNVPNFWLPMRLRPLVNKGTRFLQDREENCCALYGRLASGVFLSQAQAEMTALAQGVRSLHAPLSEGRKPFAISLTPGSHLKPFSLYKDPGAALALLLVMGAVGLVLLIACANVASLQLARSAARQKEIGVRLSLGANRLRIIRQLLTESALLGVAAGGISVLLAWGALRLLMVEVSGSLPLEWGSVALHVEPDLHVFAYVFAISLLAGVLFGTAPALEASQPNLSSALKEEGARFAMGLPNRRLRDLMVGAQVAVCLLLLIGAGLLIRSSLQLMSISPGYETKQVVCLDVQFPPGYGYTLKKQLAETRQLRQRIAASGGVRSVAIGRAPDQGGLRMAAVGLNGNRPGTDRSARTVYYTYVTPEYFRVLSIPILRGHSFGEQSTVREAEVVVSESAAEELWPGQNPIGQTLVLDASKQFHDSGELIPQGKPYQVVAVARETRGIVPGGWDSRKVYLPLPSDRVNGLPLLVRVEGKATQLIANLSKQVNAVDPDLIVYMDSLEGLLTGTPTFVMSRLAAIFASIIGAVGLLLACVGIYGTVSYAVVRREREIGIRMALGAKKGDVLGMILQESGRPVLLGLIAGFLSAAGVAHLLRALLFGISQWDPLSFAGVGVLFVLIALFAAYVPARRAALVDPMVALRNE
ncbi:MAG: ABC transporter permease [Acidobacteriaceae bacterium]|nr:ABC transporter permease [Acidobacteriaceae bacterium]